MRFASFLSGGFITDIVVNPPERKLAKSTSVHCTEVMLIVHVVAFFSKKIGYEWGHTKGN